MTTTNDSPGVMDYLGQFAPLGAVRFDTLRKMNGDKWFFLLRSSTTGSERPPSEDKNRGKNHQIIPGAPR